jgi:DNA-directed RNA polymerase II subunit RPB3
MIAEVPTLAIETIEFAQNSSSLPDEYIAHRLGLIPYYSQNADKFEYTCGCDCDQGCPKCQVIYKLDVTCPASQPYTVTSKDLIFVNPASYDNGAHTDMYKYHEEVKPISLFTLKDKAEPEPIVIAKLGPGQQLKLIARIQKGVGRVHAKWSPVCVAAYHQIAEIDFRKSLVEEMTEQEKQEVVASCPQRILHLGHDGRFTTSRIEECTFCNQCIRQAEIFNKKDAIIIQSKRGIFVFNVETVGSLSPESVVLKAFNTLMQKLDDFKKNVEDCPVE